MGMVTMRAQTLTFERLYVARNSKLKAPTSGTVNPSAERHPQHYTVWFSQGQRLHPYNLRK